MVLLTAKIRDRVRAHVIARTKFALGTRGSLPLPPGCVATHKPQRTQTYAGGLLLRTSPGNMVRGARAMKGISAGHDCPNIGVPRVKATRVLGR